MFTIATITGTAAALDISVPQGSFEEPAIPDGTMEPLNDIGSIWVGTDSPLVANNVSDGGTLPGPGFTGPQWVNLNESYIHQELTGETYLEGATYHLSVWATTSESDEALWGFFLDGGSGPWESITKLFTIYTAVPPVPDHTWTQYVFQYTATAANAGKTIGIGLYGRANTWIDDVALAAEDVPPVITSDPENATALLGQVTATAVFNVEHLHGTSYEWYKIATGMIDSGTTISGETVSFTINDVTPADEGFYYCKVFNDNAPLGTQSALAQLTTRPLVCGDWGHLRSDINRDCWVNLQDLVELAMKWLE